MARDAGLIDAVGGEPEATDWLEAEHGIAADLPVVTAWPHEDECFWWLSFFIEQKARSALGLPAGSSAVPLDGLVSLWQVDPSR
jgi:protease-4